MKLLSFLNLIYFIVKKAGLTGWKRSQLKEFWSLRFMEIPENASTLTDFKLTTDTGLTVDKINEAYKALAHCDAAGNISSVCGMEMFATNFLPIKDDDGKEQHAFSIQNSLYLSKKAADALDSLALKNILSTS